MQGEGLSAASGGTREQREAKNECSSDKTEQEYSFFASLCSRGPAESRALNPAASHSPDPSVSPCLPVKSTTTARRNHRG
jgi:hypothetical protein